jgi:hypothetical protein
MLQTVRELWNAVLVPVKKEGSRTRRSGIGKSVMISRGTGAEDVVLNLTGDKNDMTW